MEGLSREFSESSTAHTYIYRHRDTQHAFIHTHRYTHSTTYAHKSSHNLIYTYYICTYINTWELKPPTQSADTDTLQPCLTWRLTLWAVHEEHAPSPETQSGQVSLVMFTTQPTTHNQQHTTTQLNTQQHNTIQHITNNNTHTNKTTHGTT